MTPFRDMRHDWSASVGKRSSTGALSPVRTFSAAAWMDPSETPTSVLVCDVTSERVNLKPFMRGLCTTRTLSFQQQCETFFLLL
ncbi:hypothetical protein HPB50_015123 [Hyalomma asiaticum]|uniref:Uncharacterized protein n=1 Tax=Hyalomma asiaticum TaxID=266040 RepID=A0ACB7RL24_HYAAI|nr:hypothetical protein HPB50_015123 [Hyalomma asiaticum]